MQKLQAKQLWRGDHKRARGMRVKDWWVAEEEKTKLANKTKRSATGARDAAKKRKKERDYERRGQYLQKRKKEIKEAGGKELWLKKKIAESKQ